MNRPTSVGQLQGRSKWEKRLADWAMATGVSLLVSELRDCSAERKDRIDGWRRDPIELPTLRTVVVPDLFSLWLSSFSPCTLFQNYVLGLVCLYRLLFLCQGGRIPRMRKPAADGGVLID
jgi:hypothetical protein